jgi:DNA polymerase III alpha subunit
MLYHNYHRHSHYSNISTPDVIVKPKDYIERMKELDHTTYFTTEHRYGGNFLEAYDLCKQNNMKMVFGVEGYYVDNRFEKDKSNHHIILIGLNRQAFFDINKIVSEANKTGYYYKPRLDLELLLSVNPENLIVTTACVAGRLNGEDAEEKFLKPVYNHFGKNLYLEVQSHSHIVQKDYNYKIIQLSQKYNIPIIHANDSHYIKPEDSKYRDIFLQGKGIKYQEEEGFVLDYPDYETILNRYINQGVLTKQEVKQALENTLIFDKCEDLNFTKEIKMPTIYPNEDSNKKLKQIINQKWQTEKQYIPSERHKEYIDAIKFEVDIIEKTNMADYFLLNERIVDKAVNEYHGVLTRTGRGSAVSFYINKLLGFTEIDRLDAEVPLYPTRFMSTTRILESKSLPDIDYNWANVDAPIKASKDILGEDGVYYMVAFGKMKISASFRNVCRAYGMEMNEYNDVAKNLEDNLDTYKEHEKWSKYVKEAEKFVDTIESISPSPCSFILLNKPISEELGLLRVGDQICACIDGITADTWKYLKDDFLTVKVWDIISKTYQLIGIPIPNIRELKTLLNNKVWELYEKELTATLNQVDTDISTKMVSRYKPKSVAEASAFVAAIRPGFASLVNKFLDREQYSTGIPALDEILKDSYCYMLYQESIMKFLVWCGLPEDQTYDIIKKIAKKKFKEEEIQTLKAKLIEGFKKNTGNEEGFDTVWQVVEDAAAYSFNASHSLSVAWDSVYGAYLKANYPYEYYTVVLNEYVSNTDKTSKIISELPSFNIKLQPIKFRHSRADYSMNKNTNSIYKGIASIKYLNALIAEELYSLRDKQYTSFIDLLVDLTVNTSSNTRQIEILVKLNFFAEFGNNQKLLDIYNKFTERYKKTHKDKTKQQRLQEIHDYAQTVENKKIPVEQQIINEYEYLGYGVSTYKIDHSCCVILNIDTKYTPKLLMYHLDNGEQKEYKIYKRDFYTKPSHDNPESESLINQYDVIQIGKVQQREKNKLVNEEWVGTGEYEDYLIGFAMVRKYNQSS